VEIAAKSGRIQVARRKRRAGKASVHSRSTFSTLSTRRQSATPAGGQGSDVASHDDIHMPVEKSANNHEKQGKMDKSAAKPPGQFVSDELEEQTARFLEDVKDLAERRRERERAAAERHGPPPRGADQRSRRR
jgi:hypothetical protein